MSKVGHLVTDPKVGAYCQITLDSGDKILVSHDTPSPTSGTLTVAEVKWWGFGSGATLLSCALHTPEGRTALDALAQGAAAPGARPAPLPALIERLRPCRSLDEVRAVCAALRGGGPLA
jgi:hypothetical protein